MSTSGQHLYEFGPYRLNTAERLLLRNGEPVPLTPKAFETLVALVERSGHLAEKDELMKVVWSDAFVEESNLTNNVYALRKLLGQGENGKSYIETVPKRGYRFMAPVKELPAEPLVVEKRTLTRVVTEETVAGDSSQKPVIETRRSLTVEQVPVHIAQRSVWPRLLIAFLSLSIGIAVFFIYRAITAKPAAQIESIAVLPFKNESGNPDVEYVLDGMTESLINRLSQLPRLKVIARNSSFQYKGKEVNPQEASRALGVQAILLGRVTQQADRLIVSVELMDTRDKTQVWGERYTRKATDIQALQEDIARTISEKLLLRLTGEERKRLAKRYTENTEAYQLYLKGRHQWNKRNTEGFEKALAYFNQAIEKDPGYALAHAGAADSHALLANYSSIPRNESYTSAKVAALRALEIDDALAEAHASLAFVLLNEGDRPGAEREFKRAIELNPNYATAHHWYGNFLTGQGRRDEALVELKRALELDPLSLIINTAIGGHYYFNREYDRAIEQLRQTLEIDSNFVNARQFLGQSYLLKGMHEEAVAEFQKAVDLSGRWEVMLAKLGHAYGVSGRRAEAQKILNELKALRTRQQISATNIAMIYVGLNDTDRAFAWLEKAHQERDHRLDLNDPVLDGLRSDPRFQDLLRRVGLS